MTDIVGSYITIEQSNLNTSKSSVQQLVDVVQVDIASANSENTRKSYEVFTSGSADTANITSSLFQTVYDQDFTLGTANPLFDISIGSLLEEDSSGNLTVNSITSPAISRDAGGKITGFSNTSAMMREKISIYKQFSQNLLGDSNSSFFLPHSANSEVALLQDESNALTRDKKIRAAIFICFRRLFTRDNIFKGSFGLRLEKNAAKLFSDITVSSSSPFRTAGTKITNLDTELPSTETSLLVVDDSLSVTNLTVSPVSGEVSTLLQGDIKVGNIFYDLGIIVLDAERVLDVDQIVRGLIDSTRTGSTSNDTTGPFAVYGRIDTNAAASTNNYFYPVYTATSAQHSSVHTNFQVVGNDDTDGVLKDFYYNANSIQGGDNFGSDSLTQSKHPTDHPYWANIPYPLWSSNSNLFYSGSSVEETNGKLLFNNKTYPNLWVSGTIDDVLDHVCTTRFGRSNLSAITFRNETTLNSSLIFCRAAPTQLNYSTNPSYTDDDGNIIATSSNGEPFSFITTVGLYDSGGSLLAVAKTSRPIEKNPETDLSIRIRLDY
jgi:hypothetical protein